MTPMRLRHYRIWFSAPVDLLGERVIGSVIDRKVAPTPAKAERRFRQFHPWARVLRVCPAESA